MAKYAPFGTIPIQNRSWPDTLITKAPAWVSVDLRDGNQALPVPMNIEQKLDFFDLLVKTGFKEIEVGFPSASDTEYRFLRRLIEENRIPDDVTVQVLCQARDHLIEKTFECLKGVKKAVFHIYNSTSPAQRKYTFNLEKKDIIRIAVEGVQRVQTYRQLVSESEIILEYSPESFSNTEIDFALEICEAVKDEWRKTSCAKMIFNLPTTVECATANIFADQVEYFCTHISDRESVIVSVHNHNDRGCAVASAELALMAGAERVEGTLFGNGERTGNVDIVTLALNMYVQGVDPKLDFSNISAVSQAYRRFTGMSVPPRHPYAGELVFTAFSGSHQDAIRKGLNARQKARFDGDIEPLWDIPYLPIDPHDVGREYEEIIRVNSQSGKGGAAWILEQHYGISVPKAMHPCLGAFITEEADKLQRELSPQEIFGLFAKRWLQKTQPLSLLRFSETRSDGQNGTTGQNNETLTCRAQICWKNQSFSLEAKGNGPLDAFTSALKATPVPRFTVKSFHEHALGTGSGTDAIAYIELEFENGTNCWGCGRSPHIGEAGIYALVSAVNQLEL
ncbi:2-isopropylmalate synthase [Treponema sp. OMZ 840]|uniref:2-isopropylmalate synthase n=1 Tax=Treponema sp. OMZ 840 TaxID=244313 RepID=UPI003D903FBC